MRFLNLAGLWFGLVIPAIIIMYLLKRKRRDQLVASILLWEQVLRDAAANVPWQRLRRNLLLYLQLLCAAALVLALLRPALPTALAGGDVFLLIDTSASMRATDVAPDRLTAAVATARRLVGQLGARDAVTVIAFGGRPRVAQTATRSRAEVYAALASLEAGTDTADLGPALDLASALAAGKRSASLVVISDGGVLPPPTGYGVSHPLRYERIGGPATNVAVAALATRALGGRLLGLARVVNHSPEPSDYALELSVDGGAFDVRRGRLAAGEAQELVWDLPASAGLLTARLLGSDALAADDQAWAVTGARGDAKALLVSAGNIFLERALALTPGLTVTTLNADAADLAPAGYDLYIYDGVLPAALPNAPLLVVGPPGGALGGGAMIVPGDPLPPRAGEPLTEFVSLDGVAVAQSRDLTLPAWGHPFLESAATTLAYAGERGGQPAVVIGFDLHQSNLPLRPAFPILIQNIVGWLLPAQSGSVTGGQSLAPGAAITLQPAAASEQLTVTTPTGETLRVAPPYPAQPFTATAELGVYTVRERVGGRETVARFAINAPALESALAGAQTLPVTATGAGAAAPTATASRELWPWLIWLALAILAAEWWVYNRGL